MADWQPYLSVLACSWGVRDEASEHPMSTFRPCLDDHEAEVLAFSMRQANFEGDALDFRNATAGSVPAETGDEG